MYPGRRKGYADRVKDKRCVALYLALRKRNFTRAFIGSLIVFRISHCVRYCTRSGKSRKSQEKHVKFPVSKARGRPRGTSAHLNGVTFEQLPGQLQIRRCTVMVPVPGRHHLCVRCHQTCHAYRKLGVPRCNTCVCFGHVIAYCDFMRTSSSLLWRMMSLHLNV